jgi:Domain of unknown function (DUF222)
MSSVVSDYRHPAAEAVDAMNVALDNFADAGLWSMPMRDLAGLVVAVEKVARRVAAAQVQVLGQADSALVRTLAGAKTTPGWLHGAADVPRWVGRARLGLHHQLTDRPVTAAAFAAGQISQDAAMAVCEAVAALPGSVPAVLTGDVEALLVEVGRDEGTRAVVRRAMAITEQFAPDVLEDQERWAREHRFLSLTTRHDGTVAVRGVLDKETGALALAVLGPLAAPAPAVDGIPDLRQAGARYVDAFAQLCQLVTPTLPEVRGERPTALVTISLEALQAAAAGAAGAGLGLLDTGVPITIEATRKLLCDANVIPIVLGGRGEPLDIGRATRAIPTGIRRALVARDGGCAFPGCDRPPSWCDAHHVTHWSAGGATALCNLCLLCAHHHDTVHHDGWDITMTGGMPWFIPPPWIDPNKTPRQHSRHKITQLRT